MDLGEGLAVDRCRLDRHVDDHYFRPGPHILKEDSYILGVHPYTPMTHPAAYAERLVRAVYPVSTDGQLQPVVTERIVGTGLNELRQFGTLKPDLFRDFPDGMLLFERDSVFPCRRIPALPADPDRECADKSFVPNEKEVVQPELRKVDDDGVVCIKRHEPCCRYHNPRAPGRYPWIDTRVCRRDLVVAHVISAREFDEGFPFLNYMRTNETCQCGTVAFEPECSGCMSHTRNQKHYENLQIVQYD